VSDELSAMKKLAQRSLRALGVGTCTFLVLALGMSASAQVPLPISTPTAPTVIEPEPAPTQSSPASSPTPQQTSGGRTAPSTSQPAPSSQVAPPPAPSGTETSGTGSGFPLVVPDRVRSAAQSSGRLLDILGPLLERGLPADQAYVLSAPPFPVAGPSTYVDDWQFPRIGPPPHLHEGTDIFAPMGTPIVASGPGYIAGMGIVGLGGLAVWVAGDDGTGFYYAHLSAFADGLHVGQRVELGSVIGYIGNSGNAITTPPHVHFEIHPPIKNAKGAIIAGGVTTLPTGLGRTNTPPTSPKPILDGWLRQAEANASVLVGQLLGRLSSISRQLYFLGKVDALFDADAVPEASDIQMVSVLDGAFGAVGAARQAVVQLDVYPGSDAQRSAAQARREALTQAVELRNLKLLVLTGQLEEHSEQ